MPATSLGQPKVVAENASPFWAVIVPEIDHTIAKFYCKRFLLISIRLNQNRTLKKCYEFGSVSNKKPLGFRTGRNGENEKKIGQIVC